MATVFLCGWYCIDQQFSKSSSLVEFHKSGDFDFHGIQISNTHKSAHFLHKVYFSIINVSYLKDQQAYFKQYIESHPEWSLIYERKQDNHTKEWNSIQWMNLTKT